MSAAVCGSKRSLFEDDLSPSPPLSSKRLRCCCSSSPISLSLFNHLLSLFPHMDQHVIERVIQECGNDIDAAIKCLHGLCLDNNVAENVHQSDPNLNAGDLEDNGNASVSASDNHSASNNHPADGAEWIDSFVTEMTCAASVDDARARAARLLEVLEKSISAHASSEATNALQKENLMLKEQIEVLTKEKNCFKSAFRIQLERLSDYESKNQELQLLKQSVSQYQEQIRTLEVNNYALQMHLNQAQQYNPFPGRFPPDAF
ncbi:hypothetical protein TanjilG_04356 [Lupinus angustifolius]|uniref:CUE domain-containing protein n=1 Tax=Lupinus angustifolius TaxID=3871 RepID=A0A4P1RPU3_LUPAN|nr:PREDICTED: uncharacterized protein LOC109342804 [Lupinus angustifolius]OIW15821.1 hypothetical protein TanjilG_04356 [Lupinus angustifolius]